MSKIYNKICRVCDKPYKSEVKERTYCSDKCKKEYYILREEKTKLTNLKKFGYVNPSFSPFVREDISNKLKNRTKEEKNYSNKLRENTCLEKYKVKNISNSKENKEKILFNWDNKSREEIEEINHKREKTCLEKYNVSNPMKDKNILSSKYYRFFEKHGVDNPMGVQKFIDNYISTSREKYGVNHPMQNEEIYKKQQKSGYKYKDYILPSGEIVKVQGYEPKMLDILFERGYKEEDLVIQQRTEMPIIWYHTEDKKKHRYYPDIFIISENKIIEVKSDYTYNLELKINLLKKEACLKAGYKFEFKIL